MRKIPAAELLEKTHHFPGPYMFKVIGRAEDGFVDRVVAAVREGLNAPEDPPYRLRRTAGGRHVSVTLEPTIQTVQQILSVYRCVRDVTGIVLLL